MPRVCEICVHPNQAELNKSIGAGDTLRAIAKRFGVSTAGVQRHRVAHLGLKPKKAEVSRPTSLAIVPGPERNDTDKISGPQDLIDRMPLARTGQLLEEAFIRRDVDAFVKLNTVFVRQCEAYSKIAGWTSEGSTTTIIDARRQSVALFKDFTTDDLRTLLASATDNEKLSRPVLKPAAASSEQERPEVHDAAFEAVSEGEVAE